MTVADAHLGYPAITELPDESDGIRGEGSGFVDCDSGAGMDDVRKIPPDKIGGQGFGGVDVEGCNLGGGWKPLCNERGFASVEGIVKDKDMGIDLGHGNPFIEVIFTYLSMIRRCIE